ncbi:MAG TPA: hypothetical protein VF950_16610 [Planctomycetota bacterium]
MSRRGVTLIEWILLVVAGITLLALAVPAWVQSRRHADLAGCQGHLKALHAASLSAPKDPKALGIAYWTRLPVAPDLLRCPMAADGKRACDYLGPRSDPSLAAPTDPIGCDIESNHDEKGKMGGNVLYKSGEVRALHPQDNVDLDPWREAARNKCRP